MFVHQERRQRMLTVRIGQDGDRERLRRRERAPQ
jgi:hypothetical protein